VTFVNAYANESENASQKFHKVGAL
jgi:hypothetical protein